MLDNDHSSIKVAASNPNLNDRMLFKIDPNSNTIYWYIKFNILLDEKTVNDKTMFVTDLSGYRMRTFIEYSEENNIISISPIDTYSKNMYYILQITKKVKSKKGNKLKRNINIVFKLVDNQISNYEVLKDETAVPEVKTRPKNYDPEHVVSKVYGFKNEEMNTKGKDNLPYLPFKINPFVGIFGLLIVIIGFIVAWQIAVVGVLVSIVGVLHLARQLTDNEKRAVYTYNIGVRHFRDKEYDKAEKSFAKGMELDPYNEHIEFAMSRVHYYK